MSNPQPPTGTRPRSLVVGLALIALWWYGSVGFVIAAELVGAGNWGPVIPLGLWTLLVTFMMRSTWRGGSISWWFLSTASIGFGSIIMLGGVLLGPVALLDDDLPGTTIALLVAAPFVVGGELFAGGWLLRREEVRRYCNVIPGQTTPSG